MKILSLSSNFNFPSRHLSGSQSGWRHSGQTITWLSSCCPSWTCPPLASVHTVTASLIKRDFLWKQLLHQTFKTKSDFLVVYKEKVDLLITLIKQLDDVDEHQLHQSLFHHICKRFPPTSASSILMSWAGGEPATERVLSQMGFLLLERVKKSPFLVRRVYTKKYNLKFGQVLEAALEQQGEQAGTLDCTQAGRP